jgi:hypothetical protein
MSSVAISAFFSSKTRTLVDPIPFGVVDLTRSLHRLAMTAICAFQPKAGVEVKQPSAALATTVFAAGR